MTIQSGERKEIYKDYKMVTYMNKDFKKLIHEKN